ncbi:hypothetical protein MMSR116_06015 [Methylobacterium mesophilicum SR1.6/6]|uniref:Uncharacterized protein n=1 Tax=Methylobacterium mesophilicum SR1.6/6 TaxID=908290 RepID=A0A6B9FHP8_9HYPH|nr:hypothetical protein [Methylobacterium mesophilicum]QGY01509.1 hypothetical protein MMSR116_06015 [Methylobacterium mesophilicum SR1.6/6]
MEAKTDQRANDAELALDMVGRAYLALAVQFETANPGAFEEAQAKVHGFVEANLRLMADSNDAGSATPEGVATRVHDLLTEVEREVGEMSRSGTESDG